MVDVLLDCDGVLSDYVGKSIEVCAKLGLHFAPDQVTTWDFSTIPGFNEVQGDYWVEMKKPGVVDSMLPYEGAVEGVEALRKVEGVKVLIVTSPMPGGKTWSSERDEWLHRHFGIAAKDVQHVRRKSRYAGELLVEDNVENLSGWLHHNGAGRGVLWARPYNDVDMSAPPHYFDRQRVFRTSSWHRLAALARAIVESYPVV